MSCTQVWGFYTSQDVVELFNVTLNQRTFPMLTWRFQSKTNIVECLNLKDWKFQIKFSDNSTKQDHPRLLLLLREQEYRLFFLDFEQHRAVDVTKTLQTVMEPFCFQAFNISKASWKIDQCRWSVSFENQTFEFIGQTFIQCFSLSKL